MAAVQQCCFLETSLLTKSRSPGGLCLRHGQSRHAHPLGSQAAGKARSRGVTAMAVPGRKQPPSSQQAASQVPPPSAAAVGAPTAPSTSNGTATSTQEGEHCYGVFCLTYDLKEEEMRQRSWKQTIKVAVTGAAGSISNHLLFKLAAGEVFGEDQPIALSLLGRDSSRQAIEGVVMELEDSLYPLLREVRITTDVEEAFQDVNWALLIGARPRGPGMERADLLQANGQIFAEQGKALNKVADRDVKVMVVGNPCNTNALICMKNAPDLNPRNFHALTRLDENRARCQLALKSGVPFEYVTNVTVWGNHSTTQVPDFVNARIHGVPAADVIQDQAWLEEEFTPLVQKRGGSLIKKWGRSSAASTAVAMADAVKSLCTPTPEGEWFSSAVYTKGNTYGIDDDLVFSLPCRSDKGDGSYRVVEGLEINQYLRSRIVKSEEELISERLCVSHLFGQAGGFCNLAEGDTTLEGEDVDITNDV